MASNTSKLLSVRLSHDVLARIDEVSRTLTVVPGIKVTRSSTARALLLEALAAREAHPPAPQQPAPREPSGESSSRGEGSRFESWAE